MLVYRVEHSEDGSGPFNSNTNGIKLVGEYWGWRHRYIDDGHPSLWEDYRKLPIEMSEWFCGCPSENMVWWWFGPIMKLLHEHKFVLRIYRATNFEVGDSSKQVIFKRETATLITQRALV